MESLISRTNLRTHNSKALKLVTHRKFKCNKQRRGKHKHGSKQGKEE